MAWPPESLTIQTEDIINQCESMEVMPSSAAGKQFVTVVELAALLYTGEYVHARHLWRRWRDSNPPTYLSDWWSVGSAMMALSLSSGSDNNNNKTVTDLAATIWNGLAHIQATHPAPLNNYAKEVGIAYRKRVLQQSCKKQPPPQPYWTLLNFASVAEYEQFCRESVSAQEATSAATNTLALDTTTTLTQVVAFLESKPPQGFSTGPFRS